MPSTPTDKKIPFIGPSITQKEIDYVLDAVRNGWYENFDMHIQKMEQAVCNYVGVKYALATHCGTVALHLATAGLDLKPGDEVVCTDFSYVSTSYAVDYVGALPVFVDIEPETWCIDPQAIRRAITPRTKAIMLAHSYGHPAEMDEIMRTALEFNLRVIEDAASALGSEYKGKKVGGFGDFGIFSFNGTKLAVSGEGGCIVTNDLQRYEKIVSLASMGCDHSKVEFWSDRLGYQYCIGNLSASLALAQVERVEELIQKKRLLFEWYEKRLKGFDGVKLVKERSGCRSNYSYPALLVKEESGIDRNAMIARLKEHGIYCRAAFPCMSGFPIHQRRFPNPVAEKVERRGLCLPSAAQLTEEDIDFVCEKLLRLLRP